MPNWAALGTAGMDAARSLGRAAANTTRTVGHSLGEGLTTAGQHLATSPGGRTLVGAGGGGLLGATAAGVHGDNPWAGGAIGAGIGATAASPTIRSNLRYAARVEPGQSWNPIRSTANLMFRPRYPMLETAAPRAATALRLAPYASSTIGAGIAYDAAANSSSNVAEDLATRVGMTDRNDLNSVRSRAYWNYPAALWHARPTAIGGDASPFGTAVRNTLSTTFMPAVRAGVANVRTMYPTQANLIDGLRSTTPAGAAMTGVMRNLPQATFPDIPAATRRELAAQLPNMMLAPRETIQSPSFQLLRDTLFRNGEWSRIDPNHAGRQLYAAAAGDPTNQE